jgi:hypothetical protein
MPTPFEAMALASGHAVAVGTYAVDSLWTLALGRPTGSAVLNGGRRSCWKEGASCVWKAHGVWGEDRGTPVLLKPRYFDVGPAYFGDECFRPFLERYAAAVRSAGHPRWKVFVELPPADLGLCDFPDLRDAGNAAMIPGGGAPAYVHAPHWYDQLTLFFGAYTPWVSIDAATGAPALGRGAVTRLHEWQLAELEAVGAAKVGAAPCLVGEVGVPFDVDGRALYAKPVAKRSDAVGKFPDGPADAALAHTVDVLEARDLSYTLWCYEASHDDDALGDRWNREDLSIYSRRPRAVYVPADRDPAAVHFGGRAVPAFSRPYARRLAGPPTKTPRFDAATGDFDVEFAAVCDAPSEIFVPAAVHYPDGFAVDVSGGTYDVDFAGPEDGAYAVVTYHHDRSAKSHALAVRRVGGGRTAPRRRCCGAARPRPRGGPAAPATAPLVMHQHRPL